MSPEVKVTTKCMSEATDSLNILIYCATSARGKQISTKMWSLIEKLLDTSTQKTKNAQPASTICMTSVVNVVQNFIARDP